MFDCLRIFNLYMFTTHITINHLMYTDDFVLLTPSATGLRESLCACEEFSISHDAV